MAKVDGSLDLTIADVFEVSGFFLKFASATGLNSASVNFFRSLKKYLQNKTTLFYT